MCNNVYLFTHVFVIVAVFIKGKENPIHKCGFIKNI